ncbi:SDR family NAD(P)-dependent oxidoreductase [Phenylobacterium aquaticum]|uniref:SDR family NAD(P)-dependent oxidoreductase n=1 Tax=Phenylobacterium aquaticum TaxID=1763816 RepID=UPI001F5CCEA3|nr:SDR family oxidoreductase [Phenylobacterium aquaticum]MCI3133182.1 SDR family oxidoreductase [Phenylobacterium aquaticum]
MAGRLDGKVAVITGGVSGIGLGTVELFVAEGASVVAADIQDEKGAMLEKRFPGKVRYSHCDVTQESEIAATMALAKEAFGGLDILFNNAGISDRMGAITEVTADGWNWIFDILVRGPALGMKHAVPLMLERGGGSIVNTASIAGLQAGFGPIAYSTAKAGVIHMSRCAAAQLSPQKIRVNAICPGLIATSIFGATMGLPREGADQLAAMVAQNAASAQPVPKAGLPDDIAQAALYLASDAAAFVSGIHLVVDGGITVGGRHSWDPNAGSPFAQIFGETFMAQMAGADAG